MKTYSIRVILMVLFCLIGFSSEAQIFHKDDESVFPFRVSLGYNFVNDSFGTPKYTTSSDCWNNVVYPSQIGFERVIYGDLSVEGVFSYNEYLPGKIINGVKIKEKMLFHAYDLNFKYSLRNTFSGGYPYKASFFGHLDPYLSLGTGYNHIGEKGQIYGNLGVGVVYWFSDADERVHNDAVDKIGIFGQAIGKANMHNSLAQFSLGLVYKFE